MTDLKVMKRPGSRVSDVPLSPGVMVGDLVFLSGLVPSDLETGEPLVADVAAQTEKLFDNIEATLATENIGLDQVARCTIYLTTQADFAPMNQVYRRRFNEPYPARSCLIVAGLARPEFRIEIDVIASASGGKRAL